MQNSIKIIGRTIIYLAILFAAQWLVPYYLLGIGAVGYGAFGIRSDRKDGDAWAWLVAGVLLVVNAFIYETYFKK